MTTRRRFLQTSLAGAVGLSIRPTSVDSADYQLEPFTRSDFPLVVSTWSHGLEANKAAWKVLSEGGKSLDAVEKGVMVSEADPDINSVGYGGFPDSSGEVTLDACIMDENGNAGSVVYLKHIMHPVSVARLVMEKTIHVILAGEGALKFALENGFKKENLLTPQARKAWEEWKKNEDSMADDKNNHDTIGMLAIDKQGNLAGACTTSGLSFKLPGRVGDSPIIGAGLYVDNDIGAAVATGEGELVLKTVGSFLVTEMMRSGYSPSNACREAVLRINKKCRILQHHQVGFIAVNKTGETGGFSLRKGFNYALYYKNENKMVEADYLLT